MEEKDNNEPKPGYLDKNLEGHEEVYSPNAWSEIELKLKDKNRKKPFFWWFTSLGLFIVALSGILLWTNTDNNLQKELAVNKSLNSQTANEKINEESLLKTSKSGTQEVDKEQNKNQKGDNKIAGSNNKNLNAGNEDQVRNEESKS